jgi:hypothetical protein
MLVYPSTAAMNVLIRQLDTGVPLNGSAQSWPLCTFWPSTILTLIEPNALLGLSPHSMAPTPEKGLPVLLLAMVPVRVGARGLRPGQLPPLVLWLVPAARLDPGAGVDRLLQPSEHTRGVQHRVPQS